jgi:hypothetical protein
MKKIRCSLAYHRSKRDFLTVFATGVRDGIFNNIAIFPLPPLMLTAFQLLIDDYVNKLSAYENGGSAQKGAYLAALEALMNALDSLSAYVNTVADGDANIITTAGFVPTKGTSSTAPAPAQLLNINLNRGATGELMAECEKQNYVDAYICIMTKDNTLPTDIIISAAGQMSIGPSTIPGGPSAGTIDFTKTRRKKFIGLTPGSRYYFVFFGINASGVGTLSDPVSIVCF